MQEAVQAAGGPAAEWGEGAGAGVPEGRMMDKLKTLKNLEKWTVCSACANELRAMAVKHHKAFGSGRPPYNHLPNGQALNADQAYAICVYIKWANSLTEEDL